MFRILFWNVCGHALQSHVAKLARRHRVDVIALAESAITPGAMAEAIGSGGRRPFWNVPTACPRIQIFSRLAPDHVFDELDATHFVIKRLTSSVAGRLLVAVVHLPSKLRNSIPTQRRACADVAEEVAKVERRHPDHQAIVIGDFNINPYEHGMTNADALHAVAARHVARRMQR